MGGTEALGTLVFVCEPGTVEGTQIAVVAPKAGANNSYMVKIGGQLPRLGDYMSGLGWDEYTLGEDIEASAGAVIALVEVDSLSKAQRGGQALAVVE